MKKTNRNQPRTTELVIQFQGSLTDQLKLLVDLANANGLYDAADWLKRHALKDRS